MRRFMEEHVRLPISLLFPVICFSSLCHRLVTKRSITTLEADNKQEIVTPAHLLPSESTTSQRWALPHTCVYLNTAVWCYGLKLQLHCWYQNPISLACIQLQLEGYRMTLLWHHYSSSLLLIPVLLILDMCICICHSQEVKREMESRSLPAFQYKLVDQASIPQLDKLCVNASYLKGGIFDSVSSYKGGNLSSAWWMYRGGQDGMKEG